jgi:site-specific recombinase XerD
VLDIDTCLIDEFILDRQRKGAANGTVNRTLNLLRRMFNLAVEKKKLRAEQVPKFRMLKEAKPRSGFLEPEDFHVCVRRCQNTCVQFSRWPTTQECAVVKS